MGVDVRVRISQATLSEALNGPQGMVTQYVMRQTASIRTRAVIYCPVDKGRLRSSLVTTVRTDGMLVVGTVGTDVEYAAAVHEGVRAQQVQVRAHSVKAHESKTRGGRTFMVPAHTRGPFMRSVPARAGRPFLRRAMQDVIGTA